MKPAINLSYGKWGVSANGPAANILAVGVNLFLIASAAYLTVKTVDYSIKLLNP